MKPYKSLLKEAEISFGNRYHKSIVDIEFYNPKVGVFNLYSFVMDASDKGYYKFTDKNDNRFAMETDNIKSIQPFEHENAFDVSLKNGMFLSIKPHKWIE